MRLITAAVALLAAAPASAQPAMPTTPPGAPEPSRVAAGTYAVDPDHTLVGWEINHMGFSKYFGLFGKVTGTLVLDPAAAAADKLDVTIPIASLAVVSEHLSEHLKTADFFNIAQFPEAHFTSTAVTVSGTSAVITGNLTLHGVTRPVTLHARFTGAGQALPMMGGKATVGFSAQATIRRSDFGMAAFVPLVSDEVDLRITAAFVK